MMQSAADKPLAPTRDRMQATLAAGHGRGLSGATATEPIMTDTTMTNATLTNAKAKSIWIGGRQAVEVPCSIEIEQTRDTLHAHVSLEGIDVEYGDEVLVHDAPSHVAFGERSVTSSRATVVRATAIERMLTKLTAYLQLTELYEVGFQPKEEIKFKPVTREEGVKP
jgi:hypothetical protein